MVSQLASEMDKSNLVGMEMDGEPTTMKMPCIQRFLCLKKSENVNGDFSCISPSMKSNEMPLSIAAMAKKQSSALEPSGPLSNVT